MIAIRAHNLGKTYKIYASPALRLKEIFLRRSFHTEFTALNNINFSVLPGETLGIIGENGAGKSTLLKILAKTLKPTAGLLETNGRCAALLELGAGFNPEFTGEENIYLNAYLMGLSKAEIDAKKKEILDFSELGDFIGRPVKTYSSGMHVRLAFSIATSVDPDILIVDEALSVGDEYFQKKSIDRMIGFKKSGRTIVFCTHSMYHIQELCTRVIWLCDGQMRGSGPTGKVIMDYQNYERAKSAEIKEEVSHMKEAEPSAPTSVKIREMKLLDAEGNETEVLKTFEPVTLYFRIGLNGSPTRGHVGFGIVRNDEEMVFLTMSNFDRLPLIEFHDGQEFRVKIESLPLLPGIYSFGAIIGDEHALHPYDMMRTKSVQVIHRGKELGMTFVGYKWVY